MVQKVAIESCGCIVHEAIGSQVNKKILSFGCDLLVDHLAGEVKKQKTAAASKANHTRYSEQGMGT